jgi:peptidyl-prolyl cis-trans isomerase D
MFDFIRKHTRITMVLLFVLIVPSFVLWGIDGYTNLREQGVEVASVAGRDITQAEWDAAHKTEVERVRASMPNIDAKLLDSPAARYATLERMVRERVLVAAANDLRLITGDARLARELGQIPAIAELRRPDGTLDMERYRQLTGAQGMSPEMFENQVRTDLASRQVLEGLTGSGFMAAAQASVSLGAYFERREAQLVRFEAATHAASVVVGDADIEAHYKRNEARFQSPEQADIEYLVLDVDALKKSVVVNEAELRTYYDQNASRLAGKEERRASHILINAPKSMPDAERQKARAKGQELLAAARKTPDAFADLARKHSQDSGSATRGGDLDFFGRGAMVKPFEEAVFQLKKGEISELVESEFGFHIIRLTDIKAPPVPTYAEMKPTIEAELRKQQAQRKFAESADMFTNGVYEQSDSLQPVATKLGLEIRRAQGVMRQPVPGAQGPLANPKFLAAVFGADAVQKQRNTEAVEFGSSQLVAGRVVRHQPARTRPLAEVREQVKARLIAERAGEAARKEGEARLAAWRKDPASAKLGAPQVVARDLSRELPPAVVESVLTADLANAPVWVGIDLAPQAYVVARVNKVLPREPAAADVERRQQAQYAGLWSAAEARAYYEWLKQRHKVRLLVPKPAADGSESKA